VTVDHISNGRVDFGVGAGWLEREHEAYGFRLPPPRERVDRFEEALGIWNALQHQYRTTWDGEHYQLLDAPFEPKPVQPQGLPLLIGSSGPRMMRLVARHADIWNTIGSPAEAEAANRKLEAICAEVGRDPSTLRRSVSPSLNLLESPEAFAIGVAAYHAAGFTDITFPWPRVEAEVPVLREVAHTILSTLRPGAVPASTTDANALNPVGPDDAEEAALIVAALDPVARSFVRLLATNSGSVVEYPQIMSTLRLDHHADVTRLAMGIAMVFEAAGWKRPWVEVQKGYTVSPVVAAMISG
jgi:hypothetical protein